MSFESVNVAIVHDVLVQPAGGERVVLAFAKAFPGAPIYTSIYEPSEAFPEFKSLDVRTSPLTHVPAFRRHHRWAFPLMAWAFSRMAIDADVVLCSSAGWAHGAGVEGQARKIVYCHTPARWLYQTERYTSDVSFAWRMAIAAGRRRLVAWDVRAAKSADRYLVNSRVVRERVRQRYGFDAEVVPPPISLLPAGNEVPVEGLEPGYALCVSRLLAYKNVRQIADAMRMLSSQRLVIVGTGPDQQRIASGAPDNVRLLGNVGDAELRWLYRNCGFVVAAAYEDFGLVPVEAASFGKPVAALRWGGYMDSVAEGVTGVYFDEPTAPAIADGVRRLMTTQWDSDAIQAYATANFSERAFIERIRHIVSEEWAIKTASA